MDQTHHDHHALSIRLLAGLKKYNQGTELLQVSSEDTVLEIIHRLGINRELVNMASLDGCFIELNTKIGGAKELVLLPAIGGG